MVSFIVAVAAVLLCHASRPDRRTLPSASAASRSTFWGNLKDETVGYFEREKDFSGRYAKDLFVASYATSKSGRVAVGILGSWYRLPKQLKDVWGPGEDILFVAALKIFSLYLLNAHPLTFYGYFTPRMGNPLSLLLSPLAAHTLWELLASVTTLISVGSDVQDMAGRADFLALLFTSCLCASAALIAVGAMPSGALGGLPLISLLSYIALADPWRQYVLFGQPMNAVLLLAVNAALPALTSGVIIRPATYLLFRASAFAVGAAFHAKRQGVWDWNDLL